MMQDDKKYTSSDIERYHNGQMSEREKHAMEKAALEDPFLADAMDGYAFTSSAAIDMSDLRERIGKRVNLGDRVVAMPNRSYRWIAAAAALVVIAGAGLFLYNQSGKPRTDQLAEAKAEPAKNAAGTIQGLDSLKIDTSLWANKNVAGTFKTESYNFSADSITGNDSVLASLATNASGVTSSGEAITSANSNTDTVSSLDAIARQAAPSAKDRANDDLALNTRKQKEEKFKDVYRDSSRIAVQAKPDYKASNTLSEAVVISNRVSKKQPASQNIFDKNGIKKVDTAKSDDYDVEDFVNKSAEPVNGWKAYNDYLRTNKRLYATDSVKEHEVVILFTVKPNGSLVNFEVETSINATYDAEAIRLIREGPAWKNLKGKRTRMRVLVSF